MAILKSLFIALMCVSSLSYGQLSKSSYVYLHFDKHFCYSSDTIRFCAYAVKDKEDNLYIELYTDSLLISRSVFPLVKSLSNGSIVVPGRPGQYWLRAYTFNSRFFVTSVTVLPDSGFSSVLANRFPPHLNIVKELPVVVKESGPDSLTINVADSTLQHLSVSISDASFPYPGCTLICSDADFKTPETNQLELVGSVHLRNRKHTAMSYQDLVAIFEKDSSYKLMTFPLDSNGSFRISNLNFRDTGYINLAINTLSDDKPDVSVTLQQKEYPPFVPPYNFQSDSVQYVYKPNVKRAVDTAFTFSGKYLQRVIVHARWADRNAALDHRYASAWYQGHTRYNWNLMDSNRTKWCLDLGDFLLKELGGDRIAGFPFRGYRVYLDEVELLDPEWINNFDIHTDLAYVKIIEDMGPKPILAIYHRKGRDAWTIPGKLNRICVKGYTSSVPFSQPDRITSLWIPDQRGTSFTIKKHSGKLAIAGVNQKGMPVYYSTTIK